MKLANNLLAITAISACSVPVMALQLGTFNGVDVAFGGYIKAEAVSTMPEQGSSSFAATSRQSRFNISLNSEVEGHQVKGFFEGDFYGPSSAWRMRHAYMKVDNTLVGQYWTGQFLGVIGSDLLDFSGDVGSLAAAGFRTTLVHQQIGGTRISLQNPANTNAEYPDIAVGHRFSFDNGNQLNILVSSRQVENDDNGTGIGIAAKIMLGEDDIRFNAHAGEGLAAYTGVGVDVENGDKVSQAGYNLSYRHVWAADWRSSLKWTQVKVDDDAKTRFHSIHANVIHTLFKGLELGAEWRQRDLDPTSTSSTFLDRQQVEIMAKYSF
ncbi:hypothetical protein [Oceanobacter mangrovi]|uniref:hypothetical protein n=1 Tax=Oceanobacter mangrovi TaxID=2862510 RepID=UPI001C8DB2DC|nr:hypothetical protein [Oceanobacter mangrovi]